MAMNKNKRNLILYLLFAMMLFAAGCGGGESGYVSVPEQISQTPTIPPLAEPTPTQATASPTSTVINPLPTQTNLTPTPTTKPLSELEEIQEAIKKSGARWTAGENVIFSLPEEERVKYCGAVPVNNNYKNLQAYNLHASSVPYKFTLFDKLTSIKDQSSIGSCSAFATIACVEARLRMEFAAPPDFLLDLSEAHLFKECGGSVDSGIYVGSAIDYFINTGVPPESFYPYGDDMFDRTVQSGWENYTVKLSDDWFYLTDNQAIKECIYNYGPIIGVMVVYSDFFSYKSGIYEYVSGYFAGGHAVCIYGWDDSQSCWLVKNSWGVDQASSGYMWGENGCFKIAYDQCGIGDPNGARYSSYNYGCSWGIGNIDVSGSGGFNVIVEKGGVKK